MTGQTVAGSCKEGAMSIVKTFRYPVSIDWWGNGLMNAQAPEKSALRVAAPRDFGGAYPNFWSPEARCARSLSASRCPCTSWR